jgi:3-oxoacyl-(acyl-carrier-protein) synthase
LRCEKIRETLAEEIVKIEEGSLRDCKVTANKGHLGHGVAAACAMETVCGLMAMHSGTLP